MAVRTFGAQRAAGTRIEEQSGAQTITPGALGFAGYAGIFEKGPVMQLGLATTAERFKRVYGDVYPGTLIPDAAQDYYSLANGAGGLALVRVTDGHERKASLDLYARNKDVLSKMGKLEAINGGRWGGKYQRIRSALTSSADLTETTLQLPVAIANSYTTNELAGAYIELSAVPNKRYLVVGNTAAGLLTVASDQTMKTDFGTSIDLTFYVSLDNDGKAISIVLDDGDENKDTEFSLRVYVDGNRVKTWGNLNTDPASARYWVDVINNDDDNLEIVATDQWTGAQTASVRPANWYGKVVSAAANVVTVTIHDLVIASPGGGNPTMTLGTTSDTMLAQTITITMTTATAGTAVSDKLGALGTITLGTLFDPANAAGGALKNKWAPPFTVTAGIAALTTGDVLTIHYKPVPVGGAVTGQLVYPNKTDSKRTTYIATGSTHKTITFDGALDMTSITSAGKELMIVYPTEMTGGRDGNADIVDANYETAWNTSTSPFNNVFGKGLGLIKFATPGVTSTSVQKAGAAYAEAKNHQYRYEAPANILDEFSVLTYFNDTLGRSDYVVASWPSYGDVPHPDPASAREGKRKTISLTGMIHGREARIAADFQGYHKAEAGEDATLPRLLKLPTGDRQLNQELLNPAGVNVIVKKKGNFVLWGDRTLHRDSSWRFKHKREQMSYYEQTFMENFDFIMFSINDSTSDADAQTSLIEFFRPEFAKRALRGSALVGGSNPAVIIKVDDELNTDASRANGDKIASVSLKLADTTERFIIRIGQQGIFEQVA